MLGFFCLLQLANARSRGIYRPGDQPACNMMTYRYGCYTGWTKNPDSGTRMWCNDSNYANKGMWWVGFPKVSPNHTLRTADNYPGDDPTTYTPGQLLRLFIRTTSPRENYRGILMYAVNKNETKVGSWELQPQKSPYYSADATPGHLCNNSLTHSYALPRHYLEIYYFRAPPAGTGTITFRALLKTGPPNPTFFGDFLFPKTNLTLTEGPARTTGWVVLPNGQSCTQYCQAKSAPACVNSALLDYTGDYGETQPPLAACDPGFNADCSAEAPGTENGMCSYRNASCGPGYTSTSVPSCATVSPYQGTTLFCVCGVPPTNAPTRDPNGPKLGFASKRSASFVSTILGAIVAAALAGASPRGVFMTTLVGMLLFAAVPVSAHNYLEGTGGRAPDANLIFPTFPLMDSTIMQIQVNPMQRFQVEWANAHTDWTYMVVIHAANESFTELHTPELLDDYLANCPGSGAPSMATAMANAQTSQWRKYLVAPTNINLGSTGENCGVNSLANNVALSSILPTTDADHFHMPRSPLFKNNLCLQYGDGLYPPNTNGFGDAYSDCGNQKQIIYNPAYTATDAVCEYLNPNYPWIESVRRFQHTDYRCYMDATWMRIPARNGPGRYQIHYMWSSYRDTIDVDVQPNSNPVPDIMVYGNVTTTPLYAIADHCLFEDATTGYSDSMGQCNVMITASPEHCEKRCTLQWQCQAFAVMPVTGPEPFPQETQIPWGTSNCDKRILQNVPADAFVCYTVNGFRNDMNGAAAPWTMVTDPRDIGFYSTCYVKKIPKYFKYAINPPVALDQATFEYRYGDKCIPCTDRMMKSTLDAPVNWNVGSCVDCDKYPQFTTRQVPSPAIPDWKHVANQTGFFDAGINKNCSKCVKWLAPPGDGFAFENECRLISSRDPQCTEYVAFSANRVQYNEMWYLYPYFNLSAPLDNTQTSCACWIKNCCSSVPPVVQWPATYFDNNWADDFVVRQVTKTVA